MRFGRQNGHRDDYGHCDLVWSRYAPIEVFPPLIAWLDRRQPGVTAVWPVRPSSQLGATRAAMPAKVASPPRPSDE
jgi:hypothetical protein